MSRSDRTRTTYRHMVGVRRRAYKTNLNETVFEVCSISVHKKIGKASNYS